MPSLPNVGNTCEGGKEILSSLDSLKKIVESGGSVDYSVPNIVLYNQQKDCDNDVSKEENQHDSEVKHPQQPQENNFTMSPAEVQHYSSLPQYSGMKLTLDNIDISQKTHDMTELHQNPDAHYCTLMSTKNRVSGNHLVNNKPICELSKLENGSFCPNKLEHVEQQKNYVELVSRMLVDALPCLEPLRNVVRQHIPHIYSKEMRSPTETVS